MVGCWRASSDAGDAKRADIFATAPSPAAVLYAERVETDLAGLGRQDDIVFERAILRATFDDVAGFDEHVFTRDVFDGQLVDVAGFINHHLALVDGFVQRE